MSRIVKADVDKIPNFSIHLLLKHVYNKNEPRYKNHQSCKGKPNRN